MSDPSLQGSSVKSSHSPACWRNTQRVQNVNMPQLSTAAVSILWFMDSGSLTNSEGSVKSDKTSYQELSFAAQGFVPPLEKSWVSANWDVEITALENVKLNQSLQLLLVRFAVSSPFGESVWDYRFQMDSERVPNAPETKMCAFHSFEVDF